MTSEHLLFAFLQVIDPGSIRVQWLGWIRLGRQMRAMQEPGAKTRTADQLPFATKRPGVTALRPPLHLVGGGRLEVSGPRHMESCGRRLPSLEMLSVGFWPPNWGPGDRLGVLLGTVDLDIPDIAVSSEDRNNQGKRPEVTLPL